MTKRKKIPAWRGVFLRALERGRNVRLAAREAGVDFTTAYNHRKRDAGFAEEWSLRLGSGQGLGSAQVSKAADELLAGEVFRQSKKSGTQVVRAGNGRWNARAEAEFFAELGRTGSVRAAAEAAGFSATTVYERRDKYPDFAEKWRAIVERATERLGELMTEVSISTFDPEVEGDDRPKPTFSEAIAILRLKGGKTSSAKSSRNSRPVAPIEEVEAAILKQLDVLRKRMDKEDIANGWTMTEDGDMIPPGWVRAPDAT